MHFRAARTHSLDQIILIILKVKRGGDTSL